MSEEWLEPSLPLPGTAIPFDRTLVYRGIGANMPNANAVPASSLAQLTDYNNTFWVSDGSYWRPAGRMTVHSWLDWDGTQVQFATALAANSIFPGKQWFVPGKLLGPGNTVQIRTRFRKVGANAVAAGSVTFRTLPFTTSSDVAGSFGLSGGSFGATQLFLSNSGYLIGTPDDRIIVHSSWFGDTASTPSAALAKTAIWASTGIYVAPNCSMADGSTDRVEMLSFVLEIF